MPSEARQEEPAGAMSEGLRIYNLFPTLAGPVERWHGALPRIAAMGFNAVYVNPFHYPGFSGSLYAVKDYYRLNPRLRGAASASDDELLHGFTAAAARRGLRVIMDLVVNHTARDSELIQERPEWFMRGDDGEVLSPYATDPADPERKTVWGDLAELDYRRPQREAIIAYFEALVRHYQGLGFAGFRCDAAYKVPAAVWRRLIGAARAVSPDVLFCAETLGARLEEVRRLDGAGFDYLFNSAKWWDFESPWLLEQYDMFRRLAPSIAFPESHDTERLAAEEPPKDRMPLGTGDEVAVFPEAAQIGVVPELGVVERSLHHLAKGQRPFPLDSLANQLLEFCHESVDPSAVRFQRIGATL